MSDDKILYESTDDQQEEVDEAENGKKKKLEKEKQEFLNKVLSNNLKTKHDQVGFILNHNSDARNSDIELAWAYWTTFESHLFNEEYITKSNLKQLTRVSSLIRSRARIQNDYKLFEANNTVKKRRGKLAGEKREEAIEEKPDGLPMYSVYIDETGKTQEYLSVGSLWIVDGFASFKATNRIQEWKEQHDIDFEFHFNEVTKHRLEIYKIFFQKFLELNPTIGFKCIIVNKKGLKDISQAVTDLSFHLIHKGILHENESGRATLPRILQVWIDEEETGSDQLKIANIEERLTSQKLSGLYLGDFKAIDSKKNINIQAVDLFTASLNRKIHQPKSQVKIKDELADYILGLLNFDISEINLDNKESDKSKVFNLTYNE